MESIRPNDSASQRMKRMREQEHKSKKRSRNKRAGVSNIHFVSLLGPNLFAQQRTKISSTSKKGTKSDPPSGAFWQQSQPSAVRDSTFYPTGGSMVEGLREINGRNL